MCSPSCTLYQDTTDGKASESAETVSYTGLIVLPTDIKRASATHFHGFIEFHSSRSTINVVILRRGIPGMHLSYPDLLQSSLGDIMVQVTQANNYVYLRKG